LFARRPAYGGKIPERGGPGGEASSQDMSEDHGQAMPNSIDNIIAMELVPLLDRECARLGIPREFVVGVYGIWPRAFEYGSLCEPVWDQDGHLRGVTIRIASDHGRLGARIDFLHELHHARSYYRGERSSELRAWLYALSRIAVEGLTATRNGLLSFVRAASKFL